MPPKTTKAKSAASKALTTKDLVMNDDDTTMATMVAEDGDDESQLDMFSMLQQLQKKKAAKASTRTTAFHQKKNALFTQAREKAETMTRDGIAYIEQARNRVEEMKAQEFGSSDLVKGLYQVLGPQEDAIESLFGLYPLLIEEVSPRRASDINAASETLETHMMAREQSRRKINKSTKKFIETSLENQRIATDASALIKHYKALLLS